MPLKEHKLIRMKSIFGMMLTAFYLLLLVSCEGEESTSDDLNDSYIANLQDHLPEMQVSSGNLPLPSSILQVRRVRALENSDQFVVVDGADRSIALVDRKGELLSKTGGEGRGPEQFLNIAQLHVGQNGRIYLLDMLLFRITVYEVENNALQYVDAYTYKNPANHSLHRIYVTSSGKYGVFNETKGFRTPDNRFLLYRLDENFLPAEQLLEMPGHQRQKVNNPEFDLYMPNALLRQTLWDVEGEWFYYVSSYEPVINKYHLETGKSEEVSIRPISGERVRRDYHIRFFKERFGNEEYKEQWDIVERQDRLPLFSGFWVADGKILLRMFYPAADEGMMVFMDPDLEEVSYFNAPHELSQLTVKNEKIYGIDFKHDGHYRLMYMDLGTQ